jgi:Fur family ferric uptake transcriptional regulator
MKRNAAEQLLKYLAGQGLKSTSQRDIILKSFVDAARHMSAEELYARIKKAHPHIGYATVYRTLKLLAEAGMAEERRFEDGFTRYEYKTPETGHHDHLICTRCGEIVEFENERIEALQADVCRITSSRFTDCAARVTGKRIRGNTDDREERFLNA